LNWFEILKNVGIKQTQRQGISARQKDEDFIFEDDEDCLKELKTYVLNMLNKFKPEFEINEREEMSGRAFVFEASNPATKRFRDTASASPKKFYIQKDNGFSEPIPNEIYCDLLNVLKKIDFDNFVHKIHNVKLGSINKTHQFLDDFDINTNYFKRDTSSHEAFEVWFYSNKINAEIGSYFEQRRENE